jgi:hypothetical protein
MTALYIAGFGMGALALAAIGWGSVKAGEAARMTRLDAWRELLAKAAAEQREN